MNMNQQCNSQPCTFCALLKSVVKMVIMVVANVNTTVIDIICVKFRNLVTCEHLINGYYGCSISNIIDQNWIFCEWRSYCINFNLDFLNLFFKKK